MSDELRNRLQSIDPMAPGVPTESVTSESSRRLLEETMAIEVGAQASDAARTGRGRWYLAVAAALALVFGGFAVFSGGGKPTGQPLELALGSSNAMASCIQFSVEILKDMPVAFEATAVDVSDGKVTLDVDHWFSGGDAESVTLNATVGSPALIGSVDFVEGEQYLITATNGTVNACGFSGPATPELRSAFEEAFPAS